MQLNYLYRSSNFFIAEAAHQCPSAAGNVRNLCDRLHFFWASNAHLREKRVKTHRAIITLLTETGNNFLKEIQFLVCICKTSMFHVPQFIRNKKLKFLFKKISSSLHEQNSFTVKSCNSKLSCRMSTLNMRTPRNSHGHIQTFLIELYFSIYKINSTLCACQMSVANSKGLIFRGLLSADKGNIITFLSDDASLARFYI